MGATARSIMCAFVLQGVLIGLSGMVLGLAGGLTFCHFANAKQLIKLPPGSYALSYLPFHVRIGDVALVLLVTGLISLISTLYPSWNAARFQPVEVLRYE
jgi:lipoprotein-releasing system permease protein